MTDGQYHAMCGLIRGAGEDELAFSPSQFRKYYSQLLVHEKMAEDIAQEKFEAWKKAQSR